MAAAMVDRHSRFLVGYRHSLQLEPGGDVDGGKADVVPDLDIRHPSLVHEPAYVTRAGSQPSGDLLDVDQPPTKNSHGTLALQEV